MSCIVPQMAARALCELTLHYTLANNSGQIIPSGDAIRRLRVSIARLAPGSRRPFLRIKFCPLYVDSITVGRKEITKQHVSLTRKRVSPG